MRSVDKISNILKERGIRPTKMLKDLGFSTGLFTQWKNGAEPSLTKLSKIAEYLNVPLFAVTDSEFDFGYPEQFINDGLDDHGLPWNYDHSKSMEENKECIEQADKFNAEVHKNIQIKKAVEDDILRYTIELLKSLPPEDVLKAKKIIEALKGI